MVHPLMPGMHKKGILKQTCTLPIGTKDVRRRIIDYQINFS